MAGGSSAFFSRQIRSGHFEIHCELVPNWFSQRATDLKASCCNASLRNAGEPYVLNLAARIIDSLQVSFLYSALTMIAVMLLSTENATCTPGGQKRTCRVATASGVTTQHLKKQGHPFAHTEHCRRQGD